MFHQNRVWCVTPVSSAEELARKLTTVTWTCCTAFELGGYVWLNDATSPDRGQEWRAKESRSTRPPAPGREHHLFLVRLRRVGRAHSADASR